MFMVKQRKQENNRVYMYKDFIESFIKIGKSSNNLDEIIRNVNLVPSF